MDIASVAACVGRQWNKPPTAVYIGNSANGYPKRGVNTVRNGQMDRQGSVQSNQATVSTCFCTRFGLF